MFLEATLPSKVWLALLVVVAFAGFPVSANVNSEKHRLFADSFTQVLFKEENECSSTWGVSMCMDLVRPGGDSEVLTELCDGMALCGNVDSLLWDGTVSRLTKDYDGRCLTEGDNGECWDEKPTLEVANSIWIDDSYALLQAYERTVGNFVYQTHFNDPQAAQEINKWIENKTHGLIDEIIPGGPIPYDLVAVNSIYLKAAWDKPFDVYSTKEDHFYTDPSRNAVAMQKHFMHQTDTFKYSATALPLFQVIKLPYASSAMSMLIALPEVSGAGTPTATDVLAALPKLIEETVALVLPRVKFETTFETDQLMKAFASVNISRPFDDTLPQFCSLIQDCLYIADMIQKTFIEIDEKGTVAAAVTMVGGSITRSPQPKAEFVADHPFYFFIYDETEDLVLFEGHVGRPKAPKKPAPTPSKSGKSTPTKKKTATYKQCQVKMKARKRQCCKKHKSKARRRCFANVMKNHCSWKIYRNRRSGKTKVKFQKFLKKVCLH